MINRLFALRLFEGAFIQRWNDRIRPIEIVELDKHGHKAILAYLFGKMEEENGHHIDWEFIIYGLLFAYLKNVVSSDIKAPVLAKIKKEHPDQYKTLNNWVVDQYIDIINDVEMLERFREFLNTEFPDDNLNFKILRAAHKYSTLREFEIIKHANISSPLLDDLEREIHQGVLNYMDLKGVQSLEAKQNIFQLMGYIEQLRYQTRWSQTPRIPKTSVLGHSFYVACLQLLFSREIRACPKRLYNNFFAGLFHDLPESVTRDIISPVKRAITELPTIVREIEKEICDEKLYPLMPKTIENEIRYFSADSLDDSDEFTNRIILNGKVKIIPNDSDLTQYNIDDANLLDGGMLKLSDEIAAFIEAERSIALGITSRHLEEGFVKLKRKHIESKVTVSGINPRFFFLEFE